MFHLILLTYKTGRSLPLGSTCVQCQWIKTFAWSQFRAPFLSDVPLVANQLDHLYLAAFISLHLVASSANIQLWSAGQSWAAVDSTHPFRAPSRPPTRTKQLVALSWFSCATLASWTLNEYKLKQQANKANRFWWPARLNRNSKHSYDRRREHRLLNLTDQKGCRQSWLTWPFSSPGQTQTRLTRKEKPGWNCSAGDDNAKSGCKPATAK